MNTDVLVHKDNPAEFYPIFIYPNDKLREKAQPITAFDDEFKAMIEKMASTMYAADGLGLAATQVGIAKHVFILDLSEDKSNLQVFANTVITEASDRKAAPEGCLSFPNVLENIVRAHTIVGHCQDINGNRVDFNYEGLEAIAVQHELDHLYGVLMIDKLSKLKQRYAKKTVEKFIKHMPRV